ncbi:GntR family transcriptional regulator [Zestomonas carbonaria]|nr:GntR family transcriptional regulator [Pseudomonas carbonaria]
MTETVEPGAKADTGEKSSSHFIYESIYAAILDKRLAPAARLNKETLGKIFQVGSGTVQRALAQLAREGAVVMEPKQVAMVARPDRQQARQVLEARLLVESEVLRLAAARITRDELAELRDIVDSQRACLADSDSAGLINRDCRFHLRLAEIAGNGLLVDFLRDLLTRASLNIALSRSWVHSKETCRQQLDVIDALEAGDASHAAESMAAHLNEMFDRLHFAPPLTTDLRTAFQDKLRRATPPSYVSAPRLRSC